MMLGKDLAFDHHPTALAGGARRGRCACSFKGIGRKGMAPFNLAVHEGEVVGVAGLLGSGRTEMARLMFGVDPSDGGEVPVGGKPVTIRNPAQAVAAGFGFCPEDRKLDGIFGDLSVRENIIIALQAKLGWFRALNRDDQIEMAGRYAEALDIRAANHDMPVKLLSGGNQQKVILARWLAIDPTFLILDEPTRGIDVGAHAEIVRTINRLREEGLALLVISSELDEVVAYSNRIVVMRDREMVAELARRRHRACGHRARPLPEPRRRPAHDPPDCRHPAREPAARPPSRPVTLLHPTTGHRACRGSSGQLAAVPRLFHITWQDGRFFGSLIDVLNRGAPVAILAIGMTAVIATKGVDLSVGAVMAIAAPWRRSLVTIGCPALVAVLGRLGGRGCCAACGTAFWSPFWKSSRSSPRWS